MIDKKYKVVIYILFLLIPLEAIIAALALIVMPKEGGQSSLLGFSPIRLSMIAFLGGIAIILCVLFFIAWKRPYQWLDFERVFLFLQGRPELTGLVKWFSALAVILLFSAFAIILIFYPSYSPIVLRFIPFGGFIILTCLEIMLIILMSYPVDQLIKWIGSLILGLVMVVSLLLFLQGAFSFSLKVNHTPSEGASDQLAYMNILKKMHDNHSYLVGDFSRQPLLPFIESFFYKPTNSYDETFLLAKTVNIYISLVALIGFFILFYKAYRSLFSAVNLMLIAVFGIYIFKAAYFTVENLFYFLMFASFFCMVEMFLRPTKWMAVLTGITTGLAYLAKASALPALVCFGVIWIFCLGLKIWRGEDKTEDKNVIYRAFLLVGIVVVIFFLVVLPVGMQNIHEYGGFFRNVNSDIVMWFDSWGDYKQFSAQHPDLLHLPADIQPGLSWYMKTHTLQQILDRFIEGIGWQLALVAQPFNLFSYPIILLLIMGITCLFRFNLFKQYIIKYWPLVVFSVCYFLGYMTLFEWYTAIDKGPRFVMGLFLPAMYLAYLVFLKMEVTIKPIWRFIRVRDLVNLALLCLVCIDAYNTLTVYLYTREFGF
jgi:hypothetical protein